MAANVCLAHAKLHLYCLVTSHEVVVEGKQVGFVYNSTTEVPAVLCFDALPDLPALSSLAWGRAALAGGYEEALQLFKPALSWFKRALEHYQLDGWVTEHCNILFEISNLYRYRGRAGSSGAGRDAALHCSVAGAVGRLDQQR